MNLTRKQIFLLFLIYSFSAFGETEKLLDKIVAVINSKVITFSEIKRIEQTIEARKEISPLIYSGSKIDPSQILETILRSYIIKDKISSQGYVITDDSVESRIELTEQRLGLKRNDLLQFLKSKGITYQEYFEVIRETMEFNIFAQKIISPLISVSEQEIKNEYFRRNTMNKTLSFQYNLVDFYIPLDKLIDRNDEKIISVLKNYQLTGKFPAEFESIESNNLENLKEDSLSTNLAEILKETTEGSFSRPVILGKILHIFYVQKKNLVESEDFLKSKDQIQNDIFLQKGKSVTDNWFSREFSNYYIKKLL